MEVRWRIIHLVAPFLTGTAPGASNGQHRRFVVMQAWLLLDQIAPARLRGFSHYGVVTETGRKTKIMSK